MDRKCENCANFAPNGNKTFSHKTGASVPQGECRGDLPAINSQRWPLVAADEWCGKFCKEAGADLFVLPDSDATVEWFDQNAPATLPFTPSPPVPPVAVYDGPILKLPGAHS